MHHILHADFDAFYASVEQLDNPDLRGKPVVVGGSPDQRGVVASASYESRRFGIRSAMPMRTAFQRCPKAVRLPPRFDRYHQVSRQVMAMFHEITPLVEPLSLDEAFLDVTDAITPEMPPEEIAAALRRRVKVELGLTISVGVATSKSVAKIASDMDKPDGLTVVVPGSERDFLAPLDAIKLWGIGPKTAARLAADGVHTIGELASQPDEWLAKKLGRRGPYVRRLALGQDESPVVVEREAKSVSAETTLARDTADAEVLFELVDRLSQRVSRRLVIGGLRGRTVKAKLRLSDFTTFSRQRTLREPDSSPDAIAGSARAMLEREMSEGRRFRLIGVSVSGFESSDSEPLQPRLAGFE